MIYARSEVEKGILLLLTGSLRKIYLFLCKQL